MTRPIVWAAAFVAFIAIAPRATTAPVPDGRNGWSDDCPPDMMCAAGDGNATDGDAEPISCHMDDPRCESFPSGDQSCIQACGCPEGVACLGGADDVREPATESDDADRADDAVLQGAPAVGVVAVALTLVTLVAARRS